MSVFTGAMPTGMAAACILVAVFTSEMVLSFSFATYSKPVGLSDMPDGPDPTLIKLTTLLVCVLMTEIVPEPLLVTYTFDPSPLKATPKGCDPTGMAPAILLVKVLTRDTVPSPELGI